jgi:predicted TIM-barrel fold metal-dependent hydrolase
MPIPPIVDTHLHFWKLGHLSYPWLDDPGAAGLRHDYLPGDLVADAEGLELRGTVHVQAEMSHDADPVLETAWLSELAAAAPGIPTAIVGYADLRDDRLGEVLDRHQAYPRFRGIRQEAWYDPKSTRPDVPTVNLLDDPAWSRGLREMARRGLLFDLLIWDHQLPQAAAIFGALPELPVVLEHTGVLTDLALRDRWSTGLRTFAAEVPHAVMKLSGLMVPSPAYDTSVLRPLVREVLEIFGPERCVLGSNFPVDRLAVSFRDLFAFFDDCTADLTAAERAAIFHGNAARVYGLDRT